MPNALVFPGQGSQALRMGYELAEAFRPARDVFQEVNDALSQNLFKLMMEGPEADLNLTENTQPAIMAVSVAVMRVMEDAGKTLPDWARLVAGHSLGEYSALAAAGALSLSDTARLLKRRGQAMQRAVPVGIGAMAALLGLDFDDVADIARRSAKDQVCTAANDNAPGQVVVSGHKEAVERAIAMAVDRGARKSVMLPVSAPFHCSLMEPAAREMATALAEITLSKPKVSVMANVTADLASDPATIKDLLVQQVTGTVRWRESVIAMKEEAKIDTVIELGHGRVLAGLVRRIDRDLEVVSLGTPQDIETYLKEA